MDHLHPVINFIMYGMVLRVPILVGLFLVLLPVVALFTSARSLLAGLFDLKPIGIFTVTLAACTAGETVAATARLIWRHGHERFGIAEMPSQFFSHVPEKWLWVTLLTALPLLIGAYWFSANQPGSKKGSLAFGLTLMLYGILGFARIREAKQAVADFLAMGKNHSSAQAGD